MTRSNADVDRIMSKIPDIFRTTWCNAFPCACLGCVNVAGEPYYTEDALTELEWEAWMARHNLCTEADQDETVVDIIYASNHPFWKLADESEVVIGYIKLKRLKNGLNWVGIKLKGESVFDSFNNVRDCDLADIFHFLLRSLNLRYKWEVARPALAPEIGRASCRERV